MDNKSPEAFRTISEVAEWLNVPTHVLRFWESRFAQVKPVKRAGGRRYYRPSDMELLGGIRKLLHDDGMTIRGVQKLLREAGVKHVASLSLPLDLGEVVDETPSNVVQLSSRGGGAEAELDATPPASTVEVEDAEEITQDSAARALSEDAAETFEGIPEQATEEDTQVAKTTVGPEEEDTLLESAEAMEFLAHDAEVVAPEETGLVADQPDGTSDQEQDETALEVEPGAEAQWEEPEAALNAPDLPEDPPDDAGGEAEAGLAERLRRIRAVGATLEIGGLGDIAARLETLRQRMHDNRHAGTPG